MASQRFGKYLVSEVLGSGGMAEVYAAVHPDLERKVAIKVILPHFATESNFEERFRREARLVASLRHAHIVQIYDFDVVDGRYFMVMEYLQGGTLKDYLAALKRQKTLMPLAEIAKFVEAVASALDYAHGRGAIHRDIKPANILFTADLSDNQLSNNRREPVLTDFGIAKLLEDAARLTATGGVLGSPFYMPPEQATGGEVDARGDQYSLGVMLYEMVTGRLPFLGTSAVAVMTQHCNSAPPPPTSLNAALPEPVEAVLLKALAKRADDRFASAGELAQALRQAVGGQVGAAQPETKDSALSAAPVKAQPPSAGDDATLIEAGGAANGNEATLPETATLPSVEPIVAGSGDEATLVGDGVNPARDAEMIAAMVADDEATLITQETADAPAPSSQPPTSQPSELAAQAGLRAEADPEPAEIVPVENDAQQPLAHPAHSALQSPETRDDIRIPPAIPPNVPPPKPTTQHFNVGSVQAGVVNQGGEQTFSGDLSFNLNFGEVKPTPPPPAAAKSSSPAVDTALGTEAGSIGELAELLEGLRRAFAGSGRVDRLVRLVNQFQIQLDALPDERANERKQVVKRVQALLLEMTEAKPDPDMVEILATSLQRAVQPLAVVDPDLPTVVTRITSWVELIVQPE